MIVIKILLLLNNYYYFYYTPTHTLTTSNHKLLKCNFYLG